MANNKVTPVRERFEESFVPEPNSGCWLWTGSYRSGPVRRPVLSGRISANKWRNRYASHVAWELYRGPIPDGAILCHRCNNAACVNPDHLYPGTPADNMQDKVKSGSARRSAITAADIPEIVTSSLTLSQLAAKSGVTKAAINHIKQRRHWRHVEI